MFAKGSLALVTVLLLVVASASLTPGADKIKLATSVKDNPAYYLPILAAEEKGIWKRQGLEVEWVGFRAGGEMAPAIAAGHVEIGITTAVLASQWAARKFAVIVVAALDSREEWSLYVLTDSPLKKPMDLRGTKLGITRRGAISETYSLVALRALGLEKDVKLVSVGGLAEQIAALKAKAIDSTANGVLVIAELISRGEVRPLVRMDDYLPKEWLQRVITARKEFVRRDPQLVRRLLKGLFEGVEMVKKDEAWTIEKLKTAGRFSEGAAKLIYGSFTYVKDGRVDKKALENVISFLSEYGIVVKKDLPPLDELYTNEFLS